MKEKLIDLKWAIWRAWTYNLQPRALWRKLRVFWQRGQRGWSDEDVWSFDIYLTEIIIGGMKRLRENPLGYPSSLHCEDDDLGASRWDAILEEIILGFETRKKIDALDYDYMNKEEEARLTALADRGMALFVEFYGALWD